MHPTNEISVYDPATRKKKLLSRHEGESGPEFWGRAWVEIEEWLTGERLGRPLVGTPVEIWENAGHRLRRPLEDLKLYSRYRFVGARSGPRWERVPRG